MKSVAIPDVPNRPGNSFDKRVKERLETVLPAKLPVYSYQQLSKLNVNSYAGTLVVCSNGNAGNECLAYCNGRAWFAVSLGNRISIS